MRATTKKKTDAVADAPPPRKSKAGDAADVAKPNGKDQRADAKDSPNSIGEVVPS